MTISVFFVITLFVSLGNTDKSGFEIIYKDNKLPELCGLLCEEYIVGFVILTVDINVSASLVRTMYYFIYRKDHGELLTSKSSSSTQSGCSFVFSVFAAFLTTLFPVEKKKIIKNNSMSCRHADYNQDD